MFTRALLSIKRQYMKTILLMISFSVLFTAMAMTSFIKDASEASIHHMKETFGSLVTISRSLGSLKELEDVITNPDSDEYITFYQDGVLKKIPKEEHDPLPLINAVNRIRESHDLKTVEYSELVGVETNDLVSYQFPTEGEHYLDEVHPTIKGTQLPGGLGIYLNQASLIKGRLLTDDELQSSAPVGLISRQFAEINSLEPGSELHLEYRPTHLIFPAEETIPIRIKVVGIIDYQREYRPTMLGTFNQYEAQRTEGLYNSIVIPALAVEAIHQQGYDLLLKRDYPEGLPLPEKENASFEVYFILNDPEDLTTFIEENRGYLPDEYEFFHNQGELYQSLLSPLNQLDDLATKAYVLIISASFVVIFLIILLFLRDRKHELAVLISMGEKKANVGAQIVFETMLIALVSFSLSFLVALPLSSYIGENTITQSMDEMRQDMRYKEMDEDYSFDQTSMREYSLYYSDNVSDRYSVKLSAMTIALPALGAILSTVLATILSAFVVLRIKPLKLLQNT